MTSASKRFVHDMVRACMPETGSGIRFDYGSHFTFQAAENGSPGARTGVMAIKIPQVDPLIHVEYSLMGAGDGITWHSGRCAIQIGNEQNSAWEFFCERQDSGLLRVRTMAVMRQCRALKKAVYSMVRDLGGSSEAITRQLQQLGYTPDIEGLKQLISDIFVLINVEIVRVTKRESFLLEIRGCRANNTDLELRLHNLSGAIGVFIAQQLNSTP